MKNRTKYGALLKLCRKNAGLTQVEICKRVGVSQSAWSKFAAGHHVPTIDVFTRAAITCKAQKSIFNGALLIEDGNGV